MRMRRRDAFSIRITGQAGVALLVLLLPLLLLPASDPSRLTVLLSHVCPRLCAFLFRLLQEAERSLRSSRASRSSATPLAAASSGGGGGGATRSRTTRRRYETGGAVVFAHI